MWNCSLPSTSLKCYCAPETVRSSNTAGAVTRMITTAGITFTACVSSLPAYPFFRRIVSSSISLLLAYLFFRRCLYCRRIFTAGVSLSPAYLYPWAYLYPRHPAYLYPWRIFTPGHIFTAGVSLPPAYLSSRHIFTRAYLYSRRIFTAGVSLPPAYLYFPAYRHCWHMFSLCFIIFPCVGIYAPNLRLKSRIVSRGVARIYTVYYALVLVLS